MRGSRQRTVYEGLEFARAIVLKHLTPDWRVRVNRRLKSTLGTCDLSNRLIEFNSISLEYMNDLHLRQLTLHEIAHAFAPSEGHGKKFREKCRELGCVANSAGFFYDVRYIFPEGMYPYEVKAQKIKR